MSNNEAIGKLRFRIDLIKQEDVEQAYLGFDVLEQYRVIASRWADSRPINRGHQFLTTRNIEDANTHAFFIRYDDDFVHRGLVDHIRFDNRMYEIQNFVTERERDRFLRLECRILGDPSSEYNIIELP